MTEKSENKMPLRDSLAVERTKLAIERTFLAYFRSAIFFFVSGLSILKIHIFKKVDYLGVILIILSPILFGFGIYSYFRSHKVVKQSIGTNKN